MPAPLTRVRTPLAWIAGLALAGTPLAAAAALAQEGGAETAPVLISDVEGVFEIDGDVEHDGAGDWDWDNYPDELKSFVYDNGSREAACSGTGEDATMLTPSTKADDYPFENLIIAGQVHEKSDLCTLRQAVQTVVTGEGDDATHQHLYHVMVTLAVGDGEEVVFQFLPAGVDGPEGDLMIELDYDSAGELTTPYIWVFQDGAWSDRTELLGTPYLVDFAAGVRPETDGDPFKSNEKLYNNTALEYTLDLSALDLDFDLFGGDNPECMSYAPGDLVTRTGEGNPNTPTPTMKDILHNGWTIETCEEETPPVTTDPETTEPETTQPETTAPETTQPATTEPATTAPITPLPSTEPASPTEKPLAETGAAFDYGLLAAALGVTGIGALLAMRRLARDAQ